MVRRDNASYWARRIKNMEDALKDQSYAYVQNLERQFALAQAEVEKQIAAWYQRLSDNNGITLADTKKLLSKRELEEFRWTVADYIAHGQQNALDGAWMKQLENASARVHISRLEAIQLQIQQQAEALYGNQLDAADAAARELYLGSYYHTAFEVQRGLGVGWTLAALNETAIRKVLSRPWTADGQTFRDRCWTNKQALVNSVNTQLTQMIIRGEAPDAAIKVIAKQFEVSRTKAGRLVMTESAAFASAAQKDCYRDLGVERFQVVATFDSDTCGLCGDLDGQVFPMSEYEVGLTAPPFHPWCRCCTAPYFEDMAKVGERWARNPDGTNGKVPRDMEFEKWREKFVQESGLTQAAVDGTLKENPAKDEGAAVRYVGKLDKEIYRCVTGDITTDEVVITDRQIQHIMERHPGDYERFFSYFPQIIANPDYILEANKPDTAFILKRITEGDANFQLILRLKTSGDPANYKNSIITFLKIDQKKWDKYLRNKKILYRKE